MHEGVSYSFLLNIVILFVFVCGAIIAGVFSYYRAYRASVIIVNEIEKYEGYNCMSKASIAKKLDSINYNVPFNVKCKSSNCMTDETGTPGEEGYKNATYSIEAINLDYNGGRYAFENARNKDEFYAMNSKLSSIDDSYTTKYQYGVYTYMYVDLPVVNSLIRIPFYSKTRVLYEFRDLKYVFTYDMDYNLIPSDIVEDENIGSSLYKDEYSNRAKDNASHKLANLIYSYGYDPKIYGYGKNVDYNYNLRDAFRYEWASNSDGAQMLLVSGRFNCGYKVDWSIF